MFIRLMVLVQCLLVTSAWGSSFSGNKVDDMFTIKSIEGKSAVTEGTPKGIKAGDTLYFARSPFKFSVTAVKGNQVTIALPDSHDLAVGQTLMRNITEQVKKSLETEGRLKQALEE